MIRGTIGILGVIAFVAMIATPAHAVSKAAKCDKVKSTAAGKLFAKVMACRTKAFGKPTFDDFTCINVALDKCIAAFNKIDDKLFFDCINIGPDPCFDAVDAAENIYDTI